MLLLQTGVVPLYPCPKGWSGSQIQGGPRATITTLVLLDNARYQCTAKLLHCSLALFHVGVVLVCKKTNIKWIPLLNLNPFYVKKVERS